MKNIGITSAFLLILFTTIFCGNTEDKEKSATKPGDQLDSSDYAIIEQEITKENRNKFFIIEKKTVVFFMPAKQEVKDFLKDLGDSYIWEAQALFNNFANQASSFQLLIQRQNIKCVISTSEKFEIHLKDGKVVTFDRIEEDQILGQILTDGVQKPRIEYGMYNNKELATLIEEFFKIKSLGYVPQDTLETSEEVVDSAGL